jgi:integrase
MEVEKVHNPEKRVSYMLEKIKNSEEISEKNKELLLKFSENSKVRGVSKFHIYNQLYAMFTLVKQLKKDLDKTTKEDIEKLVAWIENSRYSDWTKRDFKYFLKVFYRWLEGKDEYPEEYPNKVKWIRLTLRKNQKHLPKEILTQEEVLKLIETAWRPRDKALISVLYESGCRISELLEMKRKDITFDQYGAVVMVHGKTGSRRVRLIISVPHLANWLENYHPDKNREAYVWVSLSTKNKGKRLNYCDIAYTLRTIAVKAGLGKFEIRRNEKGKIITKNYIGRPINPHLFRHTRATHLAKHLTDSQMSLVFGWVQGSRMPQIYYQLTGRETEDKLLEIAGIKEKEKPKEISVKVCPRCETNNSPEVKYCVKCGLPFDLKTVLEMENNEKKLLELITPSIIEQLIERKVKELLAKDN